MGKTEDTQVDKSKAFLYYTIAVVIVISVVYAIIKEKDIEISVKDLVELKIRGNSAVLTVDKSSEIPYPYRLTPEKSGGFNLASFDYVVTEEKDAFNIQKPYADLIIKALEAGKLNVSYRATNNNGDFIINLTNYFNNNYSQACYNYNVLYMRPNGESWIGFMEACKEGAGWTSYVSPDLLDLLKSDTKDDSNK